MIKDLFIEFIKRYPYYFAINCLLMLLVPINEIVISKLYGRLFDSIQTNTFTLNHFYIILAVMIFLQLGYCFQDYFNSLQMTEFTHFCKMEFLERVFKKFEMNSEEPNISESMDKILRTQHILRDYYKQIFNYLTPICIQLIVTIIYFTYVDMKLGLLTILLIGIFIAFLIFSTNTCDNTNIKTDTKITIMHEKMSDVITNYLAVHKEDSIKYEINLLHKIFKQYKNLHVKTTKCTIKYRITLSFIIISFLIIFVNRCHTMLLNKQVKNAVFYSIFMILANMISNMLYMIDLHRNMIFDFALIRNSGFDMSHYQKLEYKCTATNIDKDAILQIVDLSYQYPSSQLYTLKKLNLTIYPKEIVAITGHIGTGKSTLLKIMLNLKKPSSGSVLLKSKCIYDTPIRDFYKQVGFMHQQCVLFDRSIIENIIYDNKSISEQHVIYILKQHNLMKHFKDGLDVSTKSLSGGQRQLIWFLRIYFKNPELIILDEPTASLDIETKNVFVELMNTFMKDKTIIIVTHDHFMLDHVSRVVDMGKINKV
jgi:ABC-type bacteriocin/lantibiotic exporter with double-glycine peptidase domain